MNRSKRPVLKNFFEEVTLSTGVVVKIRKVDLQANSQASMREMVTAAITRVGAENAMEGSNLLKKILAGDERADEVLEDLVQFPDLVVGMEHGGKVSLLERACVSPTLDELIGWYEGNRALPDLGLGPDFNILLTYVRQHSQIGTATAREVAETKMFPDGVGDRAGSGGEEVQQAAE
ncbi:hypothetical protein [Deinococcus multiflagellatus]|uniref:Uncharacterized protein n=1 Tax=Deinococcus multiflagellatus TaxID=1656887 RepID=A0ABW1ZFW9_9DEIO|nr:hypothetical protein [Deinococcus multiflagellatus]MBZ9712177.1 hypothetical protein [Deinococcus multiflagellatus]